MKLWEITNELEMLGEEIIKCGGEVTPLMEQRLDGMEGEMEAKVERVALYIRTMQVNADAAKAEETRLAGIRKSHQRTADGLKKYLKMCLERVDLPKVNTPKVRVRIQRNSQPSCVFAGDMDDLPPAFCKITVSVDKKRVLEEWEATDADPTKREAPEGFEIAFGSHLRIN